MIILFFVIDNINIGGRNRWLSICSLLLTLLNIIIFFGKKSLLTISLILFKVVQRMIITNLEALASESYLTHYRAGGIGLALGVGAVGAILTL